MFRTVEGIYRNGKIELLEKPSGDGPARVIVTFLPAEGTVDLCGRGIDEERAAGLRERLRTFEEDWDRPDMDAYDAI